MRIDTREAWIDQRDGRLVNPDRRPGRSAWRISAIERSGWQDLATFQGSRLLQINGLARDEAALPTPHGVRAWGATRDGFRTIIDAAIETPDAPLPSAAEASSGFGEALALKRRMAGAVRAKAELGEMGFRPAANGHDLERTSEGTTLVVRPRWDGRALVAEVRKVEPGRVRRDTVPYEEAAEWARRALARVRGLDAAPAPGL